MCCKLMAIPSLEKPRHSWCPNYVSRRGCGIYAERPRECSAFECLYLAHPALGDAWRPDKARFMIWVGRQENRLMVEVDPAHAGAWKREPYYSELRRWADRTQRNVTEILVRTGTHVQMLFPEGEVDLGPEQNLPIASGYEPTPTGERPFARYVAG